jgi:hypothetical protein
MFMFMLCELIYCWWVTVTSSFVVADFDWQWLVVSVRW